MAEPILDPRYWKLRLRDAREEHHAIFRCSLEAWRKIEDKHREILAQHITVADSILDAGCGWGRLLTLMPKWWGGAYLGLDISPDFIELARERHPYNRFEVADLRDLADVRNRPVDKFDFAILISIRPMVKRNLGEKAWADIEKGLRKVAARCLYLEYDEDNDGGGVE